MPWLPYQACKQAALKRAVDGLPSPAACSECEAQLEPHAHRCPVCLTLNDTSAHGGARRYAYAPETPAPWVDVQPAFLSSAPARAIYANLKEGAND